tara:strand:- start:206 stop:499 length:294 start_codon:yes stop_codon:yes gene_type:complete
MTWFKLLKKDGTWDVEPSKTEFRNEMPCKLCTNTTYTRYGLEFQCTDCGHNSEEMAEKYLSRSQLNTRAKKQRVSRTPSKKERNRKKREARRAKRRK